MRWVVNVILASFLVGVLLSVFDINPARILTDTERTVREVVDLLTGVVGWALPYILVGAVIVVPIAVLSALGRWTRGRRPRP